MVVARSGKQTKVLKLFPLFLEAPVSGCDLVTCEANGGKFNFFAWLLGNSIKCFPKFPCHL